MSESDNFKFNDTEKLTWFWKSGLLWFVNRIIHPWGLAIAVEVESETQVATGLSLLSTDDPEGIEFAEEQNQDGMRKFRDHFLFL